MGIPCEKMSLQWPDKQCNGILWMVLGEERRDPARCGDELWRGSARIETKPGLIGNNWPIQAFGGELALIWVYGYNIHILRVFWFRKSNL